MLLTEVNHVGWLAHRLLQVPYHKVLTLVDREELTHACCKLNIGQFQTLREVLFVLSLGRGSGRCVILEVEVTPLDLNDGVLAGVIPNREGCCEALMVQTIKKK